MTVRLLVDFKDPADGKQYVVGNLYTSAANEAGLIAAKQATSDLTGGTDWVAPAAAELVTDQLAFVNGAIPWTRLWGPNELNGANVGKSAELSGAWAYSNITSGPTMFRREGAAIRIDGGAMSQDYGNLNTFAADTNFGMAAGSLYNKTIAINLFWHRLNAASNVQLRIGTDGSNYVTFQYGAAQSMLVEGFNTLLFHTGEAQGAVGSINNGLIDFQSSFISHNGWTPTGAGFDFKNGIPKYIAIVISGVKATSIHNSVVFIEGLYIGGKDRPRLTIGFDIQTSDLDLAKNTLDAYGFKGYAAVPTANGAPATPAFLWSASQANRLKSLYAAGWDIIQHSVSHNSMGNYTDEAAIQAEIDGCRNAILALGCPRGADMLALPNNSNSNRVVAVARQSGVKWICGVGAMLRSSGLIGDANPLYHGRYGMNGTAGEATQLARLQAYIDLLIMYGASGHVFTHGVVTGATDSLNVNITTFNSMMSYIKAKVDAGLLEVVTPSQFVTKQVWPDVESITRLPNRLAINQTNTTSPLTVINSGYEACHYIVSGGTVSKIEYSKDGTTFDDLGVTAGLFVVSPGDRLRVTYTVAPTIIQQRIVQ